MEKINFKGIVKIDEQNLFGLRLHLDQKEDLFQGQLAEKDRAAWEYVEQLEGTISELFEKLKQTDIEDWNEAQLDQIRTIRKFFELKFKKFRAKWMERFSLRLKQTASLFDKIKLFWKNCAVQSPLRMARLCEKKLKTEFKQIEAQYREYIRLSNEHLPALKKFEHYSALANLGKPSQEAFKRIYFLLKLLEHNTRTRVSLKEKLTDSLSKFCSIDHAIQIFKRYENSLKERFFQFAKTYKRNFSSLSALHQVREELHCLGFATTKYRDFFLSSHPDPYVRSRWGFPEEVTGEEPDASRKIAQVCFDLERLDRWIQELENAQKTESSSLATMIDNVEKALHEMAEPLLTKEKMHRRAQQFLSELQLLNEFCHPETASFVSQALSKALLSDWKFFTLFEMPLFHEIVEIHCGLIGEEVVDPTFAAYIESSKSRLEQWHTEGTLAAHQEDVREILEILEQKLQEISFEKSMLQYQYVVGGLLSKLPLAFPNILLRIHQKFEDW